MGQAGIDAVLAGTKAFAVALLAPLTTRIGNRPRVAADPGQILAAAAEVLERETAGVSGQPARLPELWEGKAAERIVAALLEGVRH